MIPETPTPTFTTLLEGQDWTEAQFAAIDRAHAAELGDLDHAAEMALPLHEFAVRQIARLHAAKCKEAVVAAAWARGVTVADQDARRQAWAAAWLAEHRPGQTTLTEDDAAAMLADLPPEYLPSADELRRERFEAEFDAIAAELGVVFTDDERPAGSEDAQ